MSNQSIWGPDISVGSDLVKIICSSDNMFLCGINSPVISITLVGSIMFERPNVASGIYNAARFYEEIRSDL